MRRLLNAKNNQLAEIIAKSQYLVRLNRQLLPYFEEQLRQHCQIANFDKGVLIVEVDSAAWGTRLRYSAPDLLKKFRAEAGLHNLRSLKCYVRPRAKTKTRHNKAQLSQTGAFSLEQLSEQTQDPDLKSALQRLANHYSE